MQWNHDIHIFMGSNTTNEQELGALWYVGCTLQRMWYTRGKVPQIPCVLETEHDWENRQ